MKKLFIFSCVLLISGGISAQKVRFGFKGTMGYSQFKSLTKSIKVDNGRAAYGYGIMFDFNISDHYAFSTGVDMAYKGGKLSIETNKDDSLTNLKGNSDINLQYLELPIGLKMKTNEIGPMTYFLNVGTSLGLRISTQGSYKLDSSLVSKVSVVNTEDDKLNDYTNPMEVALALSLGAEYNISGNTSLMLAFHFSNNFMNVLDKEFKANKLNNISIGKKDIGARLNVYAVTLGIFF